MPHRIAPGKTASKILVPAANHLARLAIMPATR